MTCATQATSTSSFRPARRPTAIVVNLWGHVPDIDRDHGPGLPALGRAAGSLAVHD
ncbi:MAG: hypothetical protein ACRDMI_00020 [Streptosporangiaceae bacterium]